MACERVGQSEVTMLFETPTWNNSESDESNLIDSVIAELGTMKDRLKRIRELGSDFECYNPLEGVKLIVEGYSEGLFKSLVQVETEAIDSLNGDAELCIG